MFDVVFEYFVVMCFGLVWLGVWFGNVKVIVFYEKVGFKWVGMYDFKVGVLIDFEFIYCC